jgi:uncharacterized membrane protein YczE
MRAAPSIHGGFATRFAWLLVGLFLCSCGIVCFLESELGLPPWDVLHQGLAEQLGISFGSANIIVSLLVLTLSWALRAHIGLGTFLNALLIGSFLIVLAHVDTLTDLSEQGLASRIVLLAIALPFFGAGSAFYISASMGAGPRDSLMLVISKRVGIRVGAARTALELAALAIGFALGGTAGIGTLVFGLGIGPAVELSFWLLERTPLAAPAVASAAA